MTTPNADLIRRGYDAFGRGDIAAVLRMLDSGSRLARAGTQPAFWRLQRPRRRRRLFRADDGAVRAHLQDRHRRTARRAASAWSCSAPSSQPSGTPGLLGIARGTRLAGSRWPGRRVPRVPRRRTHRRSVLVRVAVRSGALDRGSPRSTHGTASTPPPGRSAASGSASSSAPSRQAGRRDFRLGPNSSHDEGQFLLNP